MRTFRQLRERVGETVSASGRKIWTDEHGIRTMEWKTAEPKSEGPCCAACGRVIKGKNWVLHIVNGGEVLHPADEELYEKYGNKGGEMGYYDIGPECRKVYGEFAIPGEGAL